MINKNVIIKARTLSVLSKLKILFTSEIKKNLIVRSILIKINPSKNIG